MKNKPKIRICQSGTDMQTLIATNVLNTTPRHYPFLHIIGLMLMMGCQKLHMVCIFLQYFHGNLCGTSESFLVKNADAVVSAEMVTMRQLKL